MASNSPEIHLLSPLGFRAAAVATGIKTSGKPDVALLVCDAPATAAAAFTTNKVFAAPVKIGRDHIAKGALRAIVVNAGNANACTGRQGERDALRMCQVTAEMIGARLRQVLPSSTGIIGHLLPMTRLERGIRAAAGKLGRSADHAAQFADAILTTDLVRKSAGVTIKTGQSRCALAGVCKGSGMIGPRMTVAGARPTARHATMLAYLTSDARISAPALRRLLSGAVEKSFNAVTVDDHTSTNDTVAILCSGLGPAIESAASLKAFSRGLDDVCQSLARQIAADGEGATKVVRIEVRQAKSRGDAQRIARAIANSPLVKCAMHGNDPNWGRIVSAAGMCGAAFDPGKSTLKLQKAVVFRAGQPREFNADAVSRSMNAPEVVIELSCGIGTAEATLWTCDLSKEYVTINADYHT